MWSVFASACALICKRCVTKQAINECHKSFGMFCRRFQEVCGDACKPNMHLSLHLKEYMFDYGPVNVFWCFSYERFSDILGKFHINNHSISITMLRKSLLEKHITHSESIPAEYYKFLPYIAKNNLPNHVGMSKIQRIKVLNDLNSLDLDFSGCETTLWVLRVASLTNQEFDHLETIIRKIYKEKTTIRISRFVKSKWCLQVGNEIITTESYRRGSLFSHSILAKWFGREY